VFYPVNNFAPDLNPLRIADGIIIDGDAFYPTEMGGIAPLPSPENIATALPSRCLGLFSFQTPTNNFRIIGGTQTKLYELGNNAWIDRSRAGDYSGTSGEKWRFTGWGTNVVATNFSDPIQKSASTDFSDLVAEPKAKFIATCQNFVIAAYTYDTTDGTQGNRVWWCAQGDFTDWTPSLSTQAGWVNLDDTPGAITGLVQLGNYILVFKDRALYLGSYIGPPLVWEFRLISKLAGTFAQEAVAVTESGVYFIGHDDFYYFDGASLQRQIGYGIRKWFFSKLDTYFLKNTIHCFDPWRRLIFWFFPTTDQDIPSDSIILHYPSGRFGRWNQTVEAAANILAPKIIYDSIGNHFATYNDINVVYDHPWWGASFYTVGIINGSHQLQYLSGDPLNSYVETGFWGEVENIHKTYRVWPIFNTEPTTCLITPKTRSSLGGTVHVGTDVSMVDGKGDVLVSGRFSNVKYSLTGDFEFLGHYVVERPFTRR